MQTPPSPAHLAHGGAGLEAGGWQRGGQRGKQQAEPGSLAVALAGSQVESGFWEAPGAAATGWFSGQCVGQPGDTVAPRPAQRSGVWVSVAVWEGGAQQVGHSSQRVLEVQCHPSGVSWERKGTPRLTVAHCVPSCPARHPGVHARGLSCPWIPASLPNPPGPCPALAPVPLSVDISAIRWASCPHCTLPECPHSGLPTDLIRPSCEAPAPDCHRMQADLLLSRSR